MRLRVLLITLTFGSIAVGNAFAYPWPMRPFDRQHEIRANFGDPRTRFLNTLLTDGLAGPGTFLFHNGIDISAREGTPVYPVVSGRAKLIDAAAVLVRTKDGRTFQYFHIVPVITNGEHVVARRSVLGYVLGAYQHLHFAEIRGHRIWNPLARDGITPYRDSTVPQVDSIGFRAPSSLVPLDPARVCGAVSIVATAYDPPSLKLPGTYAGYAVSPAFVTWSLRRSGGRSYATDAVAADFRTTLPVPRQFWDVYARGSFQNSPRFSNRQFFMPGRYLYNLAGFFHTRAYPNGVYEVSVHVTDMRGNSSETTQRFTIANRPASETGCPGQEPSSSP